MQGLKAILTPCRLTATSVVATWGSLVEGKPRAGRKRTGGKAEKWRAYRCCKWWWNAWKSHGSTLGSHRNRIKKIVLALHFIDKNESLSWRDFFNHYSFIYLTFKWLLYFFCFKYKILLLFKTQKRVFPI